MKRKLFLSYSFRYSDGRYGVGNTSAITTELITMTLIKDFEKQLRESLGATVVAIITWHVLEE